MLNLTPKVMLAHVRNFAGLMLGGPGGAHVFLGCLLGVLTGMIPGINLTLLACILLLLIFNVNAVSAAAGIIVGKILCPLLAPYTFEIGYEIIHERGLEELPEAALEVPVLPWMDLHRYCLLGGIPLALVAGSILGLLGIVVLKIFRRGRPKATEKTEPEGLPDPKEWIVRKWGFVLSGVTILTIAGVGLVAPSSICGRVAARGLEPAFGAEVNVAAGSASIFQGTFELGGIEITDPDKPTHNVFHIEKLTAHINAHELLRKRFVIDKLEVTAADTNTHRKSPGKVYDEADAQTAEIPEDAVCRYVQTGEELRDFQNYLSRIRKCLKARYARRLLEQEEGNLKERLVARGRSGGFLSLSAVDAFATRPAWTIREAVVHKLGVKRIEKAQLRARKRYGEGAKKKIELKLNECRLEIRELSSSPELNAKPITFRLTGPAGSSVYVVLTFEQAEGDHMVRAYVPGLPLVQAIDLTDAVPVSVSAGKVSVGVAGTFNAQSLRLPLTLHITGLESQAREGEEMLGLEPPLAKELFENLSQLTLNATVEGSIDAPRLTIDDEQMIKNLKNGLVRGKKLELLNRISAELIFVQGEFSGMFRDAPDDEQDKPDSGKKEEDKQDEKQDDEDKRPPLDKKVDDLLKLPF